MLYKSFIMLNSVWAFQEAPVLYLRCFLQHAYAEYYNSQNNYSRCQQIYHQHTHTKITIFNAHQDGVKAISLLCSDYKEAHLWLYRTVLCNYGLLSPLFCVVANWSSCVRQACKLLIKATL